MRRNYKRKKFHVSGICIFLVLIIFSVYLSFYMVDKENALVHVMAVFNGKKDYIRVMRKFF